MKKLNSALGPFLEKRDADAAFALARVWRNWADVVGSDIAELVKPLGHRGTTVLLGVEDSMIMQEMRYYAPSILEQVNGAVGGVVFDNVQIDLLGSQISLEGEAARENAAEPLQPPQRPDRLGGLLDKLPRGTAVGDSYHAYVRYFEKNAVDHRREQDCSDEE